MTQDDAKKTPEASRKPQKRFTAEEARAQVEEHLREAREEMLKHGPEKKA